MVLTLINNLLKMSGYVDEMPESSKIRGRTLYYTIRFNLVHFLNTPFRFHKCQECGKKFICHSLFFRKGHFGHNGCMQHWLQTSSTLSQGGKEE